jgi:osmotically-inducible protein OsmY
MNGLLAPIADRETVSPTLTPPIGRTAEDRLRASGYLSLRDVSCVASNGVACLHGCLPSYYLKQVAQEIAAGVEGVRFVINKIEVSAPARPGRAKTGCTVPANDSF